MKYFLLLLLINLQAAAQPVRYTTSNAHSHNDYHQPLPFRTAYEHGFGSIEADIFLVGDELVVAHDTQELKQHRTLEQYYVQPLLAGIRKNNGHVYADSSKALQLMIDVKTNAVATLNKLISLIQKYPQLTNTPLLKWVISGNRPPQEQFITYPAFIWFDGELVKQYSREALTRIVMLSDDFEYYSRWNGQQELPVADREKLQEAVAKGRLAGKPVRFWNAPDNERAWKQFMELKVGFINTDHIEALDAFLHRIAVP